MRKTPFCFIKGASWFTGKILIKNPLSRQWKQNPLDKSETRGFRIVNDTHDFFKRKSLKGGAWIDTYGFLQVRYSGAEFSFQEDDALGFRVKN